MAKYVETLRMRTIPQKFEDLNLIKSLQTLACFAIAKELWSHPQIKLKIDACLREEEYRNGNAYVSRMLIQLLDEVNELAKNLYPIVPIFFKQNISEVINFVGEDIFDWVIVSENHHSGIIQEMIVWNIHLTPFHTIDRIKSGCVSQSFNLSSETLCKCCFQKYVEKRWKKLDPKLKEKFEMFFGPYKFHAIAYWKCYVHIVDYRITQEKIIVRNRQLFENFSPLENIFKISVYCGYDVAVVYYWNLLTNQQKVNNINALLSKKYSPVSKLEAWMERWTNEMITSKAQTSTFCFLWNQLPEFYRRKLMLFSYWSVFIIIIRWRMNDQYFKQIFNSWRPMFIAPKFYERTLRVAASNITKGEKYEKIFNYLWKPVANLYSYENVAEFIWKYVTVYEDIESAAFIINTFEKSKKIEIMASLNQMLYVYNVNQKYQSQLQDFLATEISLHQPLGDIQIDINDETEQDPGVQKVSLFILLLIFLVYLFFIFMCIITPTSRTHELKRFLTL